MVSPTPPGPLYVLAGPPGSGKSTWARANFRPDQVVSSDALRKTISGDPNNQDATPYAIRARNAIVEGRVRLGLTTVVDSTNCVAEHRAELGKMSFQWLGGVHLARNARRRGGRRVPDGFIRDCHEALVRDLPVASTVRDTWFTTGIRVRPDGCYALLGGRTVPLVAGLPSIRSCPDWVGPHAP